MKANIRFSLGLLVLGSLLSCARAPQQIVETPAGSLESERKRAFTVIRVGNEFGDASGFFVAPDKIATNIHVVAHPSPVLIKSPDKETLWNIEGVTAFDAKNDLVILKVAGGGMPLPLADSDTVRIGASITAVGYPGGKYKLTNGSIHGVREGDKWLRIKAKLTAGSSGSPIISKSQVIGIVSGTEEPYSYAIPSNALKALLDRSEPVELEPLAQWRERGVIRAYVYSVEGQRRYNANRYEEAITDFDKAIQLNPEKADAYYNRGLARFRLADFEAAQENIEKARQLYEAGIADSTQTIKLNPEDAFAYHNRAGGKFRLGQFKAHQGDIAKAQQYYQDAIQDWRQVIKRNAELAEPYNNCGIAKATFGDSKAEQGDMTGAQALYAAAIQDCTQAIRLNPASANPYNNRAYAKIRLGDSKAEQGDVAAVQKLYTEAIQDCTLAIALEPENATAYGNRGVAKAALGNAKGAIEDFDAAIRMNPAETRYYHERERAKKALGQNEEAKSDFEVPR